MTEFLEQIKDIRFTEVDEFYKRKEEIREKYQELDDGIKEIYKWYFYFQFCLLKNPLKEMFWTYLNINCDIYFMADMSHEYRLFCKKRNKICESDDEFD